MSGQLPLALRWPAQQRLETYVPGDNAAAVALLRSAAEDADAAWVYASGPSGCGKTHLLLAACAAAATHGRSAQYLPLAKLSGDRAAAIRAFGGSDVLALDDVDAIAGDADAEHALFDLYNCGKADKSTLLFSATKPPAQLGIGLADLVSRLSSSAQATLKPLDDAARREAVRQRAQLRGLVLDDAVLDWLFARTQRDLGSLTALIERLDRESLAAKRRITVPFLRQLLGGEL
jgi:DnaA family protein